MRIKLMQGQLRRPFAMRIAAGIACSVFAGCGSSSELAKVRGRVEFDGKTLPTFEQAAVILQPSGGRLAKGIIANDGTFQLSTYRDGDGAVVGAAKISVSATVKASGKKADRYPNLRWVIPEKFGNADTAGLTCEVMPGQENVLRIVLRSDGSGVVERE